MEPKELIERCCYCKRIKDHTGEYNRNMVISDELAHLLKKYNITDGICPRCLKAPLGIKK